MTAPAFIETQFPVSKISKESYKERKAVAGQTLTGLGKWWGRKPLVLVRATVLGLLLPAGDDPAADQDVFLKLMTMDEASMRTRRIKSIPAKTVAEHLSPNERNRYLEDSGTSYGWASGVSREDRAKAQDLAFEQMGYDEQLNYCARPEQIEGPSEAAWADINAHCGTTANNLQEWTRQMGEKQFGAVPKVGDAFCGGGSIPFEAARLGCEVYASDLNPVAALLTWASLNIIGGGPEVQERVINAQREAFEAADAQITEWGIEHNERGWRADAYLYCVEVKSPASGYWVPLAPSWVISEKYKVCAVLHPDHKRKRYDIEVITGADKATFKNAKNGTVQSSELVCPKTGKRFKIAELRGDRRVNGETQYGLRMWENEDIIPRPEDTFQERLYCIRYLDQGGDRHYCAPDDQDLAREEKVLKLLRERFTDWQDKGYIPSSRIPSGYNTEQPIRERGWTHWHHLFNVRQLLINGCLNLNINKSDQANMIGTIIFRVTNNNSRLARWKPSQSGGNGGVVDTFSNQALNTLYDYGIRTITTVESQLLPIIKYDGERVIDSATTVATQPASGILNESTFWITDPPYADAVNYHELGDFFLAWYEKHLPKLFPKWSTSARPALAVKGKGQDFNQSMVEVYRNLTEHMPDHGAQVVMFTHQDSGVWADLALILWASGLRVTAAWTIQTETDASGIKKGNYVQGTVIMVLRKRLNEETGFLTDIQVDIEYEVKKQIDFMRRLDEGEDPNFGDTDYQLAAYAAALKELTRYARIGEIDVERELTKTRGRGEANPIQELIESAVSVALDYLVPKGLQANYWRRLTSSERFYLKGLQIEQGGEYRAGVYTELARGYGLHEYRPLLGVSKANENRLKTATEFGKRELKMEGDEFNSSLMRHLLFAIYVSATEESATKGRDWLYHEWGQDGRRYWDNRQLMIHLLGYLLGVTADLPQWQTDQEWAEVLRGVLENHVV